jgi:hypothetical protein
MHLYLQKLNTKVSQIGKIAKNVCWQYVYSKLEYTFRHLHTAAPPPTVSGKGQTEDPRCGSALRCYQSAQTHKHPEGDITAYCNISHYESSFILPTNNSLLHYTRPSLHPVYCGVVLGPWTCWGRRKQNGCQVHKRWFCAEVCWTWAVLGGLLGSV